MDNIYAYKNELPTLPDWLADAMNKGKEAREVREKQIDILKNGTIEEKVQVLTDMALLQLARPTVCYCPNPVMSEDPEYERIVQEMNEGWKIWQDTRYVPPGRGCDEAPLQI